MSGSSDAPHSRFGNSRSWLVAAALIAFCAYRLVGFVVVPLDAPGTLRPVLYHWYTAFLRLHGRPAEAVATWRALTAALFVAAAALALFNYAAGGLRRPRAIVDALRSRWTLVTLLALALFVGRFPTLLAGELNPDEGQFIAAAQKLFYDPIYFRSVDVGTSGPVNILPLMLPAVFGFSPDYASSRVVVLAMILLDAWLIYRALAWLSEERAARLAMVPIVGWFAVLGHPDLVHYSSEQVPLLLIAVTLYLCARLVRQPEGSRMPVAFLGLVTCATFFAKMQALPIVLAVAGVGLLRVLIADARPSRVISMALRFAAGAAPLLVIAVVSCLATGTLRESIFSYILANVSYQSGGYPADVPDFVSYLIMTPESRALLFAFVTIAVAFAYQSLRGEDTHEAAALVEIGAVCALATTGILYVYGIQPPFNLTLVGKADPAMLGRRLLLIPLLASPALCMFVVGRGRRPDAPLRWFGAAIVAATAAAVLSVWAAHRLFPHYVSLLFIAVCAAVGWMLVQRTVAFVAMALLIGLLWQKDILWSRPSQDVLSVPATVRPPEGEVIRSLGRATSPIAVWGWTVRPYLGSGRVPATRDTNMANFFRDRPAVDAFYRARFLRDLRRARPDVFVDAIGPVSLLFHDRAVYGFEQFPEIASFVQTNYALFREQDGQRIYARRDLLAPAPAAR